MHPVLAAILSQLAGVAIAAALGAAGLVPPRPLALAFACGVGAALVAASLRSARWWLPIHLAFAPLLVVASGLAIPPLAYLGAFIALLLVYGSSYRTQVPLYLSNRATIEAVGALLPPGSCRLLDLGSGTGTLVRELAVARPDCQLMGVESSPLPHAIAAGLGRGLPNLELARSDFFALRWSGFDVVYAFLSPVPMQQVWDKAIAEMDAGSLLISNTFAVPEVEPAQIVAVDDRRATRLYCYRMASGTAVRRPAKQRC